MDELPLMKESGVWALVDKVVCPGVGVGVGVALNDPLRAGVPVGLEEVLWVGVGDCDTWEASPVWLDGVGGG